MTPIDHGVRAVATRSDFRDFIRFPARLYRHDANWAPPIWLEEGRAYTAGRNPVFAAGETQLFVARSGGQVVGRVLAYVDSAFNQYYRCNTGFFGAFESIDNTAVGKALIEAGADWLSHRGMTRMRGPINPVVENWGTLIEGFDDPPVFLTPYNPPYYARLAEAAGLRKAKDLLAYVGDCGDGYELPSRFESFSDRFLQKRPEFSVRRIDRGNLTAEAERIWKLSNVSLADNWGYVPVDRQVMLDMVQKLRPILDSDAVWFVQHRSTEVGFALGWPDVNVILRATGGHLLPFGFIRFLRQRFKLRRYRLFGLGVLPEYQGLGLDALLYTQLYRSLRTRGVRLEANYILEDNANIRNALEKMQLVPSKRYRLYEMPISHDASSTRH